MGNMQLNKASKKTRNIADETQASAAETNAAAEMTPKPRTTRSSKTKKTETPETGSVKHHHKGTSTVADAGTEKNGARTLAATVGGASIVDPVGVVIPAVQPESRVANPLEAPARSHVTQEEIAKLAYTYWIARGYAEGGAEEDWLRAERELTAKH
jgi:Protein of unknown function (DUF2934)